MSKLRLAIVVVLVIVLGFYTYSKFAPRDSSYQRDKAETDRLRQIKELTVSSKQGVPDEKTANETQKKLCQLTARSIEEQSKAIEAIKGLTGNSNSQVNYKCSDSFYDTAQDKLVSARSETYLVGLNTLLVNPKTNHVVQVNLINEPLTKASKKISQPEAETIVREFITKHTNSLGVIDLSKLKAESNKKGEGKNTNYFFIWQGEPQKIKLNPPSVTCSKDINPKTPGLYTNEQGVPCYKNYESNVTPIIQVAINNQGQILNYANSFEGEIGREITF